ncbi:C40 family peptidase [Paenibacillus tarimensis]|uniref:C40 family peptidase n=1 Tax=Paenibacillus tarimensis TaxID=416012 RepID=UPI0038B33B14
MKKVLASMVFFLCMMTFTAASVFADSRLDNEISDLIGIKYKSGGSTTSGFDCSGFTSYVFRQFKIELPRTSAAQSKVGKKVAKENLQAGDLVFFNTSGKGVSHVGIFVGNGKFAHSSSSKGVTISKLSDSYYVKRYMGARRVMNADTYEAIAAEPSDLPEGDGDQD